MRALPETVLAGRVGGSGSTVVGIGDTDGGYDGSAAAGTNGAAEDGSSAVRAGVKPGNEPTGPADAGGPPWLPGRVGRPAPDTAGGSAAAGSCGICGATPEAGTCGVAGGFGRCGAAGTWGTSCP
jgi:hypothetical protein